jgi:leucyl aminopeptidase
VTTPKIELLTQGASKADTIVMGWFQEELGEKKANVHDPRLLYAGKRNRDIDELNGRLKASRHFFGKKNETSLLRFYTFGTFSNVLLIGLGQKKNWTTEAARQAGAAVGLIQRKERLVRLALAADSIFPEFGNSDVAEWLQCFCEGYFLSGYEYVDLKKTEATLFHPEGMDVCGLKGANLEKSIQRALALSEATLFARSLGDRPANYLTPSELGRLAGKMAKDYGLKCTVLGRSEIAREKMGLFLGVAQGSAEEPKFIILEHRGGKKADRPIALVGKGITFDTGGISIKPAARMEDMKYDMMGAATVIGICQAVAALRVPCNIIGFIPTCENMPDGKAQKPGDVAKSITGKTVEIINTDAEGRLILADALEFAQTYNPQAIFDFATLTGAVVDALGKLTSGIMGNHQGLIDQIKEAASVTGERVWQLPLYDEYEEDLRSSVADIKNSGVREAGSQKGGIFLKFFVDSKFPWAHCDIAGTAYHRRDLNYLPQKYAAGVLIRTFVHLLSRWKSVGSSTK